MFEGVKRKFLAVLVILCTLALVGGLIWHAFNELEPSEYIPVLIAVLSAFIGLIGVIITQTRLRIMSIEDAHRQTKADIYFGFVKLVQAAMMAQKEELSEEALSQEDMAKGMIEFKSKCQLWASEEVLMAISNFIRKSNTTSGKKELLRSVEKVYRAMREDIGLKNSSLPNDFFAKWPLSDPSEFDRLTD